jgi:hypothetical protein
MEGFVLREDVPDGLCQLAGEINARHLGAALAAEALLRALVSLDVPGIASGVRRRLDERPAKVRGTVLGERAATVLAA